MKNEHVIALSKKYEKSPNQIVLRWGVERGWAVIPKASSRDHLLNNIAIGDFKLEEEEVELLN